MSDETGVLDEAGSGYRASGLAVIGAGFGRTGTRSLQAALQRLSFDPCDHMHENFAHPERFALWREALRRKDVGRPIDWRSLHAGYRAVVDWPGAYFWRELAEAHLTAKVELTVRDPEAWCASMTQAIFPLLLGLEQSGGETLPGDVILDRVFSRRLDDRAHCLEVLADHIEAVRVALAPGRPLVFDVREGWALLCAFPGAPAPADEPFPRQNSTEPFLDDVEARHPETVEPSTGPQDQ